MTTPNIHEPSVIELEGEGPFELPFCTDITLAVGAAVRLIFKTSNGQRVLVPIDRSMLAALHAVCGEALKDVIPEDRDVVH